VRVRLGERQGGVEVGCLEDGVADDLTGAGGRAIGRDADTAGDGVPKSTMRSPTSAGPGGPSAHDGFHLLGGGRRCFRGVIGAWWVKTYLGMICCFSQNRRGPTTSGRVFLTRCAVRQCLLESPAPAMIWSRPMEIVARETAPILDVCHHCLRTATSRDYVTKGAGRPILNRLRWRRRVISPSIAHRGAGITAPRLTRATRSISDRGYEPRLWDWRCRALLARRTSTR